MSNAISSEKCTTSPHETPLIMLCGGQATRLRNITNDQIPKHLIDIGGRTILEHALAPFAQVPRIILATGRHGDQIQRFVEDTLGDVRIEVVHEETPLGVIGAIHNAITRADVTGRFMLARGDEVITNFDASELEAFHSGSNAEISLLASSLPGTEPDFAFRADQTGRATRLTCGVEAGQDAEAIGYGTGIFVCEQSVMTDMVETNDWATFLHGVIAQQRLHVLGRPAGFYNFNTPEDLDFFSNAFTGQASAVA